MKKPSRLLLFCLCLSGLCSCDKNRHVEAFSESGEIRLQTGGNVQFRYDPPSCQMSFNQTTLEFMAFNDSMSDYYSVRLSEIPTRVGQAISADLIWTTSRDVLHRNNVAFETVRLEGDSIWLWSYSARIGVSLRILE